MKELKFENLVWMSRKAPRPAYAAAVISIIWLVLETLVIIMEGMSFFNVFSVIIAFAIFIASFSAIGKRGAFVQRDAIFTYQGTDGTSEIVLEYMARPDAGNGLGSRYTAMYADALTVIYNKYLKYIKIKGMKNEEGKPADIYIYNTAPLESVFKFLIEAGADYTIKAPEPGSESDMNNSILRTKDGYISISGNILRDLIRGMAIDTEMMYLKGTLTVGQELMFNYNEHDYIVGVRYDQKTANSKGLRDFDEKFLSVYMDEERYSYADADEFYNNASLCGHPVKDILGGIYVDEDEYQRYYRLAKDI
jgi:hypothetical protein